MAAMSISERTASPFYETYKLFKSVIDFEKPLTFEAWNKMRPDHKAAALYINFFDQITLAYYKCRSWYSPEEDNVEIVLQYLEKNVPIIEENPKRFTPNYIYRVAYNCMDCQSRGIKRDIQRFETEVSNITVSDSGDSVDLFDFTPDNQSVEDRYDSEQIWAAVFSLGDEAVAIVENLIYGNRLPAGAKAHKDEIVEKLKVLLKDFAPMFN